jgi:hypothetical protein
LLGGKLTNKRQEDKKVTRRYLHKLVLMIVVLGIGAPSAFGNVHWVTQNLGDSRWNSVRDGIVNTANPGSRLAGTNPALPAGISTSAKYARIVLVNSTMTPQQLASTVTSAMADPNLFVAINEISNAANVTGTANTLIAQAAAIIGPGYANRWGAYIAYGSASSGPDFQPFITAIDAVYANHGSLLPEFYAGYAGYFTSCSGCTNDGQRDVSLNSRFFSGAGKLSWLMGRRPTGSLSQVHPIFAVGTTVLTSANDANNARFLDRLFYVFVTRSGWRTLALNAQNPGGIGSYKWDDQPWGTGTNTTRDNYFSILWNRYSIAGATTPNWAGAMPTP